MSVTITIFAAQIDLLYDFHWSIKGVICKGTYDPFLRKVVPLIGTNKDANKKNQE